MASGQPEELDLSPTPVRTHQFVSNIRQHPLKICQRQTVSLIQSSELTEVLHISIRLYCNLFTIPVDTTGVFPNVERADPGLEFTITRPAPAYFFLDWNATGNTILVNKPSISAADLYWLEPETERPIHISSASGSTHPSTLR